MQGRHRSAVPHEIPFFPLAAVLAVLVAFLFTPVAHAQPFGSWIVLQNSSPGYVRIPHSGALNPNSAITIEGWVSVTNPGAGQCRSLIGKNYMQTWWVGFCGNTLRSFLRGNGSNRDAGVIADNRWHHFAVTYNGVQRCHYVDGVQIQCWMEPGGMLPGNTSEVRIGSDTAWPFTPTGAINEIRLWSVARSVSQLRSTINVPVSAAQPGLVAVWAGGGPTDVVGPHDGTTMGDVFALTFPVTNLPCANSATSLCLHGRFTASVEWKTSTDDGPGRLTPLVSTQSGVFWFFNPTNWELMVKVLNGCPLNDRWWVFSAATTNVFYRLTVFDREGGAQKIFFNYPGPPAPAVTDTGAFNTCP
jgi:hypothetical protein